MTRQRRVRGRRGLEPIHRAKTINLEKHEIKALFDRGTQGTSERDTEAGERVEGMGFKPAWDHTIKPGGGSAADAEEAAARDRVLAHLSYRYAPAVKIEPGLPTLRPKPAPGPLRPQSLAAPPLGTKAAPTEVKVEPADMTQLGHMTLRPARESLTVWARDGFVFKTNSNVVH